MTVTDDPGLFDYALRGEPLPRMVFPEPLDTRNSFWTVGNWSIGLPFVVPQAAPQLQRVIREIRGWTGWSARRLADVVGSSHTTVRNAENGRPLVSGHSGDLRQRLVAIHDLVERIYVLVDRDAERTATLLTTAPPGRCSAVEELRATGDAGRAYIALLDTLRPRRVGLLTGGRPRRDVATTALHE
jgi:hypothetical protein